MMKVRSNKDVFIRSKEPFLRNWNKKGVLYEGQEVDVIQEVKGEALQGNSVWYQDKNGDYYWSGGFTKIVEPSLIDFKSLIDYSVLVKINGQLPVLASKKVVVAVLDTGIYSHPDLKGAVMEAKSFVPNQGNDNNTGHGTSMAGIIGARTTATKGIKGLVPNCNILDYKVLNDTGSTNIDAVKAALTYILSGNGPQPDVINMSFSVASTDTIADLIAQVVAKGILVVVAAGEENIFQFKKKAILSNLPGVVAVGAAQGSYLSVSTSAYPVLDFVFDNVKQWSAFKPPTYYNNAPGDSIYTAVVSGLLAREVAAGSADALNSLKQRAFGLSDYEAGSLKLYKL